MSGYFVSEFIYYNTSIAERYKYYPELNFKIFYHHYLKMVKSVSFNPSLEETNLLIIDYLRHI